MDTLEAIRTRRSIRAYTDELITDEQIDALLSAAMQAPSAGNQQPWHFIVIRKRAGLEQLADMLPYGKMLHHAAAEHHRLRRRGARVEPRLLGAGLLGCDDEPAAGRAHAGAGRGVAGCLPARAACGGTTPPAEPARRRHPALRCLHRPPRRGSSSGGPLPVRPRPPGKVVEALYHEGTKTRRLLHSSCLRSFVVMP